MVAVALRHWCWKASEDYRGADVICFCAEATWLPPGVPLAYRCDPLSAARTQPDNTDYQNHRNGGGRLQLKQERRPLPRAARNARRENENQRTRSLTITG